MTQTLALTTLAQWITNLFFAFDYSILSSVHAFAQTGLGRFLAPILYVITLTGAKGIVFICVSLVLLFFRKTRRAGICALLALTVGLLITNIIIKPLVARPRPYDFNAAIRSWWEFAGSHAEKDLSFPSGHMNAACAFVTAIVLSLGKKWLIPSIVYVLLMGFSRVFLMVHYPSDVIGGLIFGVLSGVIAFFIVKAVYKKWGQSKLLKEA